MATIVAVSMSVDRLHVSDEELDTAVGHAVLRLPSSSSSDLSGVVALAGLEVGRDLTWDQVDRDDDGGVTNRRESAYDITLQSAGDEDSRPAACLEVTTYSQAGSAANPASYTVNPGGCDAD